MSERRKITLVDLPGKHPKYGYLGFPVDYFKGLLGTNFDLICETRLPDIDDLDKNGIVIILPKFSTNVYQDQLDLAKELQKLNVPVILITTRSGQMISLKEAAKEQGIATIDQHDYNFLLRTITSMLAQDEI